MTVKSKVLFALVIALSCAAWAGDGIPMGNAVFYPSIEAVYTHTDNIYLQDSTMPNGNVSDNFWVIRPMLGFEFPFKESYVRLDLGYQYQDYQTYNLSTHDTYTADLKGIFKFGNGHSFTFQDNFIRGLQEVSKFDPGYEQYYSNTPFNNNDLRLGLDFAINKLNTLGDLRALQHGPLHRRERGRQDPLLRLPPGGRRPPLEVQLPPGRQPPPGRPVSGEPPRFQGLVAHPLHRRQLQEVRLLAGPHGDRRRPRHHAEGLRQGGLVQPELQQHGVRLQRVRGRRGPDPAGHGVLLVGFQGQPNALPVGLQHQQLLHQHGRRTGPPPPDFPLLLLVRGLPVPGERLPRHDGGLPARSHGAHDG